MHILDHLFNEYRFNIRGNKTKIRSGNNCHGETDQNLERPDFQNTKNNIDQLLSILTYG